MIQLTPALNSWRNYCTGTSRLSIPGKDGKLSQILGGLNLEEEVQILVKGKIFLMIEVPNNVSQ